MGPPLGDSLLHWDNMLPEVLQQVVPAQLGLRQVVLAQLAVAQDAEGMTEVQVGLEVSRMGLLLLGALGLAAVHMGLLAADYLLHWDSMLQTGLHQVVPVRQAAVLDAEGMTDVVLGLKVCRTGPLLGDYLLQRDSMLEEEQHRVVVDQQAAAQDGEGMMGVVQGSLPVVGSLPEHLDSNQVQ